MGKKKVKKKPQRASNSDVEVDDGDNPLTLEDISWAGGDQADLALLAGVESEDEREDSGKTPDLEELKGAVAAFAASVGLPTCGTRPGKDDHAGKRAADKMGADKKGAGRVPAAANQTAQPEAGKSAPPEEEQEEGMSPREIATSIFSGKPLFGTVWWEVCPFNNLWTMFI